MSSSRNGSAPERESRFAAALHAAIEARGLPLNRIEYRLKARGTPVSAATLSHWQRGRTQPERGDSLKALRSLEELLDLDTGALSGLLAPPRPRGRGRRESTMQPLGSRWGMQDEIAALLPRVGAGGDERLTKLSQHDRCVVGPDRKPRGLWIRQVLRASEDGPERWLNVFRNEDPGPLPEPRALRNCRLGRVVPDQARGILIAELLFDRPLRRGETLITEHEFLLPDSDPGPDDSCSRTFRLRTRHHLTEVRFHPDALPADCRVHIEADSEPNEAQIRLLEPDASHSVHALAVDFGPGRVGIHWRWDPDEDPPHR